jgi:hypothetical protein
LSRHEEREERYGTIAAQSAAACGDAKSWVGFLGLVVGVDAELLLSVRLPSLKAATGRHVQNHLNALPYSSRIE